ERRALLALALVTVAVVVATAIVGALGDRRRVEILLTTPGSGDSVPVTQSTLSLTFSRDVQHSAVERALRLDPPAAGSVRWHGRSVAAITGGEDPDLTRLILSEGTAAPKVIVDSRTLVLGGVGWSADSQALLVVRRDRAVPDQLSVPRTWVVRKTGEFLAPID